MKQDYTLTGSNYKDEKKVVIDQNGVKREALVKQRESVLSKVGIKLPVCCMMNLNTCAYYQTLHYVFCFSFTIELPNAIKTQLILKI